MGTITIEVDESNPLVHHIEDLQRALTKRNETIERLQARIDAGEESPLIQAAYERGRKAGWKECANRLQQATREAQQVLTTIDRSAFDAYLEGDRIGRASSSAGAERSEP